MGEIRIVSPGKTRDYPYPVCKKIPSLLEQTNFGMNTLSNALMRVYNVVPVSARRK